MKLAEVLVMNPVEAHFFLVLVVSEFVPLPYGAELMIDGAAVSIGELPPVLEPSRPAVCKSISPLSYGRKSTLKIRTTVIVSAGPVTVTVTRGLQLPPAPPALEPPIGLLPSLTPLGLVTGWTVIILVKVEVSATVVVGEP